MGLLHYHRLDLSVLLTLVIAFSTASGISYAQTQDSDDDDYGDASSIASMDNGTGGYYDVYSNTEGHKELLRIPSSEMLFNLRPVDSSQTSFSLTLKPDLSDFYHKVGLFDKPKDTVFVYPSFTQAAYDDHGFYNYYRKQCDSSCLTIPIPEKVQGTFSSSIIGGSILKFLDYPYLKDEDIDKNPDILKQYKKVIILHNEYVTKKEFDAITRHPNVVFLYPNALYAEVATNYTDNTITLVRGHGYPDLSIKNGFDWKDDNTRYEYNVQCNNWNFYHKDNYTMMNCYPEYRMLTSDVMLELLQKDDPTTIPDDLASWLMYPKDQNVTQTLLNDFDVQGTAIPTWVAGPALWLSNGEITKRDFSNMLQYLSENQIIK